MVVMERRGSMDGRTSIVSSNGAQEPTTTMPRSSRINVAPLGTRFSRGNILPTSVGRGTNSGLIGVAEQPDEPERVEPSPTASRLRSLARSVRAVNTLGALKVRKRYLASAPTAATGSVSQSVDTATISPPLQSSTNPMAARVIVLPTNEFSTKEMKFRLEPLEPVAPTLGWNVLDTLTPSDTSPPPIVHRPSSAALTGYAAKNERQASTPSLAGLHATSPLPPGSTVVNDKSRWKTLNAKAVHESNNNSDNPSTAQPPSPLLRRGQTHSAGPKQSRRNSVVKSLTDHLLGATSPDDTATTNTHHINVEARLCCARSLYKLSCQAGCELSIINGGAISQLAEFSDIDHLHLHELCAATLANLTTEPLATDAFVANDGIPALLELSWSPSITVKLMCATALCRLSCRSIYAAALARARASIEVMSMISLPSEQLQKQAISCLVNLMYFGHTFPERIFVGDPHAIQSQQGILNITSQLALAPQTMQFAAEVLFNLTLYRTSCSGVLRGGGADILHGLAIHVSRSLDEHHFSGTTTSLLAQQTPRMAPTAAMTLLRLIAHTLANFSAHSEFQSLTNGSVMKILSLMLVGALRDLGSRFYSGQAEERLRLLAVPCSRTLANLSSSEEQRKYGFTSEIVQLTTKLYLMNRSKVFQGTTSALRTEAQAFERNILRTIANLSFHEPCAAHFMEFPDVIPRIVQVVLHCKNDPRQEDDENRSDDVYDDDDYYEEEEDTRHDSISSLTTDPSEPMTHADDNEMKEDALIAILNLARQGAYSHELLKHLDGKQLTRAAEEQERGSRLKYVYDIVLCNILFESRLQQLLYGDLVVNALIDGFYFFASSLLTAHVSSGGMNPFSSDSGNREAHIFQDESLAFPDDQERFLVAIIAIAGEIMDARNIDRLVTLVLDCMRPMDSTMTPAQRKWRRHITGNATGVLYALARSSATRGDTGSRIYAAETVQALIDVCEGKATAVTKTELSGLDVTGRTFTYNASAQAFSAATLYHICSTGHFNPRVIQALISACNSNEESLSLLACSAAFAIISFTPEGRQQLVASKHLAKALNRLGRTSQVECQQHAALAACNVSTLNCIWSSHELKDFIVVALLRANSVQAKQIHAKTLANLLSHIKTRAKAVDDGVLYALMKLSQVSPSPEDIVDTPTGPGPTSDPLHRPPSGSPATSKPPEATDNVFHLGLQVLFNLSCEPQYHQKLMGNGVIAYLATAVLSIKQTDKEPLRGSAASVLAVSDSTASLPLNASVSTDSRRYAMGIICNLSSYESNHKELMNAQVIEIIRSYVDHDVETRASAAMAIRNLSCRQPWVEMICERRTLHMLITFTHCDHAVVRHFAIQALANCSQVTDSLHLFGELKVTRAVMAVLETINPKPQRDIPTKRATTTSPPVLHRSQSLLPETPSRADSRETCMAALKYLHNVGFDDALALNLMEETTILRLQQFMESRELDASEEAGMLATTMISVLAEKPRCAEALLRQRVVGFCALLHRKHPDNAIIAYETCLIFLKLSTYQPIQAALTDTQAIHVVVTVCTSACARVDERIRECGVIAIRNLSLWVVEPFLAFEETEGFGDEEQRLATSSPSKQRPLSGVDRRRRHPDTTDAGAATVSRLTERHLMQGVQFFQQEIDACVSTMACSHERPIHAERILTEACAGITNLSTVKLFRTEMVRAGVVSTLVRLLQTLQSISNWCVPSLVTSMCSTILHRLALEEEATVDGYGLLIPSLLDILDQRDEQLHQVRYECEKVSFPPSTVHTTWPPLPTGGTMPRGHEGGTNHRSTSLSSTDTGPTALIATTTCVKQTYRAPKWITYIVKAMLSSATMVPAIDKKQIRAIGQPKLSFVDADATTLFAAPLATDNVVVDDPTTKRKGGYLLSVHLDKFTAHLDACLQDGATGLEGAATAALSVDGVRPQLQLSTGRSSVGSASSRDTSGSSHDREALVHMRKFDQHMRLTRRNHRHTKVPPVLSFM